MVKNAPYGDNYRHGAVKNRTQVYNPHNQRWTKIDKETNLFVDQKANREPFKRVREEKVNEPNNVGDFESMEKEFKGAEN